MIWNGEKCDRKWFSFIQNGRQRPFCKKFQTNYTISHFSPLFPTFLTFSHFSPLFTTFSHFSQLFPTFHHFSSLFITFSHFFTLFPTFHHFTTFFHNIFPFSTFHTFHLSLFPTFHHFSPLFTTFPYFSPLFTTFHHFSPLFPTFPLFTTFSHFSPHAFSAPWVFTLHIITRWMWCGEGAIKPTPTPGLMAWWRRIHDNATSIQIHNYNVNNHGAIWSILGTVWVTWI